MSEVAGKKRRPWWRQVIRGMVVLIIFGAVVYAGVNYWAARKVQKEVAAIRDRGEPMTFGQLDAMMPAAREEEDAGKFYEAAMALSRDVYRAGTKEFDLAMEKNDLSSAEVLAEARKRVEENELALGLLDRGTALPGCSYDIGIHYGMNECLRRLEAGRRMVNAASLRSQILVLDHQEEKAVDSVLSELRATRVFDREPMMIVFLVKAACLATACRDAEAIIEHGGASASGSAKLRQAMKDAENAIDLKRIFLGERVYYLELLKNVVENSGEAGEQEGETGAAFPEQRMWPTGLMPRVLAAESLPTYGEMIAAAGGGWPGVIDAAERIAREPHGRMGMLADLIAPQFAKTTQTAGRMVALLRSVEGALDVERYRTEHQGRLPESLSEARVMLKDPFDGKALKYRKQQDGFVVYSVGIDRRDDGGKRLNGAKRLDVGVAVGMAESSEKEQP